ncbi:hypothetical protein CRE_03611 [Caenorhabditis remanei]|uniref:Uncharacterized protein n=1 Tax=Caenorhabditis remanei TaxID=31234 RepID=E3LX86_CAERE|nr:hypothetical protein CRE_03611 [Caenorhabditis remanei]
MNSDQDNASQDGKAPSLPPASPSSGNTAQLDADIPGFEYELEENVVNTSSVESTSSSAPDFESGRHPNAKLFVIIFALLGNSVIIYQACRDIPREYRSFFCLIFSFDTCILELDRGIKLIELFEFLLHITLELLVPLSTIITFFITQLLISLIPIMSYRLRNPVPMLAKIIFLTMFLHCLANILKSLSMLSYLGTTDQKEFWQEYLIVSGLGLFWMYQLLNMSTFSRLTTLNYYRAQETVRLRNNPIDDI